MLRDHHEHSHQSFCRLFLCRQRQHTRPLACFGVDMSTWRNPRGGYAITTALERCTKFTLTQCRSISTQSMRPRSFHPAPRRILPRPQSSTQCKREAIRLHIQDLAQRRRKFSTQAALSHGHIDPPKPGEELYVTFVDKEGDEHKFAVSKGDNLLDIAQANDLEMEGELASGYALMQTNELFRSLWRFMCLFNMPCHC